MVLSVFWGFPEILSSGWGCFLQITALHLLADNSARRSSSWWCRSSNIFWIRVDALSEKQVCWSPSACRFWQISEHYITKTFSTTSLLSRSFRKFTFRLCCWISTWTLLGLVSELQFLVNARLSWSCRWRTVSLVRHGTQVTAVCNHKM